MRKLERSLGAVSLFLAVCSSICAALIMVTMTADVLTRLTRGGSLAGAYEMSETLVVLVVFLGFAYAERSGTHVRVTLLTSRIPVKTGAYLRASGAAIAAMTAAWMAWASTETALTSLDRGEYRDGLVNFPLWPARAVVALGLLMVALEFLLTAIRAVRRTRDSQFDEHTVDVS